MGANAAGGESTETGTEDTAQGGAGSGEGSDTGDTGGGGKTEDTGVSEVDALRGQVAELQKFKADVEAAKKADAERAALAKGEHEQVIAGLKSELAAATEKAQAHDALLEATRAENAKAIKSLPAAQRAALEQVSDPMVQRQLIASFKTSVTGEGDIRVKKGKGAKDKVVGHPPAVLSFAKRNELDPDYVAETFPKLSDPNHRLNKGRSS